MASTPIRLTSPAKPRRCTVHLLHRQEGNEFRVTVSAIDLPTADLLRMENRFRENRPLRLHGTVTMGLLRRSAMSDRDFAYSPEGGDYHVMGTNNIDSNELLENGAETILEPDAEETITRVVTVRQGTNEFLFVYPEGIDTARAIEFIASLFPSDKEIGIGVVSAASYSAPSPVGSALGKCLVQPST